MRIDVKQIVVWSLIAIVIVSLVYGFAGYTTPRGESQYTGQVVDVVEDKGLIFKPTYVNMKTHRRSSTHEKFCILDQNREEQLSKLYNALENGDRVTVTYSAPAWVRPSKCGAESMAIVRSINVSG